MSGNETTSNQRHFYPRPPQGGRQFNIYGSLRIAEFLSTPSARRATQPGFMLQEIRNISIHALRKEGDFRPAVRAMPRLYFYPRPPQGGRPPSPGPGINSARYFYPRPPQGGRLHFADMIATHYDISIHALRKEGDAFRASSVISMFYFYPRPPQGGRQNGRRGL